MMYNIKKRVQIAHEIDMLLHLDANILFSVFVWFSLPTLACVILFFS